MDAVSSLPKRFLIVHDWLEMYTFVGALQSGQAVAKNTSERASIRQEPGKEYERAMGPCSSLKNLC